MPEDVPGNVQVAIDTLKELKEQEIDVSWESDACPVCSSPLKEHRVELTPIVIINKKDKKVLDAYSLWHGKTEHYCFVSIPEELLKVYKVE